MDEDVRDNPDDTPSHARESGTIHPGPFTGV